jgi:hypothetical protein
VMLDELAESMDENRNTLFNLLLHSAWSCFQIIEKLKKKHHRTKQFLAL